MEFDARMTLCDCKLKQNNVEDCKIRCRSYFLYIVREFGGFFMELVGLKYVPNFQLGLNFSYNRQKFMFEIRLIKC